MEKSLIEIMREFLSLCDLKMKAGKEGFTLTDLQGAPAGDIEDRNFSTLGEMFRRLELYFDDIITADIEERVKAGEDIPADDQVIYLWTAFNTPTVIKGLDAITPEIYNRYAKQQLFQRKFIFDGSELRVSLTEREKGFTSIEEAVKQRLEELEVFVPYGAELELSYDETANLWRSCSYSEQFGRTPLVSQATAFKESLGLQHRMLYSILNKSDVYLSDE